MKKHIQKWKSINKNGLKLSLICGLNWLIKIVFKGQFYLFSAVFCGLLTYYMPQDIQLFTVRVLELIIMLKVITDVTRTALSRDFKRMKMPFFFGVMYVFFLAGNTYIKEHVLTELIVNRLFTFWLISLVLAALVAFIQPRLFKHYLFKNVINKEYLGIRKLTDELPPISNLYVDVKEVDADKRMRLINQNVIKPPYQDAVELSYLNREVITAISYKVVPFNKETERTFIDDDSIYYPIFTVHPFGSLEGKSDFYHTLIKLRLSQKNAFTTIGVRDF
ncbi:TPA: hypothetical protein TUL06_001242 [Streptococcus equi subsp. zooepidemicus]|nr:hypothetical protein [Streptococcus equi subsp. zooepidemicus]HEL0011580.1 hypothetical protein [Streptococcus equi subsp. zooepidemicus]HEL0014103.1 hypothetical protein [Streptococcus equi subsp. zooepidemicus]HEL0018137.1 hypothetical protein [Streptococcus equi subsp. zooepidemicus]HEL0029614.1 hypothetical protein [Streptococcus equi subsp. zooepidemicus]